MKVSNPIVYFHFSKEFKDFHTLIQNKNNFQSLTIVFLIFQAFRWEIAFNIELIGLRRTNSQILRFELW